MATFVDLSPDGSFGCRGHYHTNAALGPERGYRDSEYMLRVKPGAGSGARARLVMQVLMPSDT